MHPFCLCAQRLPKEILDKPEFESYFVGAESKIDQVLSSTWLKAHTKHWTWKNFIMANTPRWGAYWNARSGNWLTAQCGPLYIPFWRLPQFFTMNSMQIALVTRSA